MGRVVVCDSEFNRVETPDKLWCILANDLHTDEWFEFRVDVNKGDWSDFIEFGKTVDHWIGHNFISYDSGNINRLVGTNVVELGKIRDTLVASKLIRFKRKDGKGHGLGAYGERVGIPKPEIIDYDNPELIETYVHRCKEDVKINKKIYLSMFKRFFEDEEPWKLPFAIEHFAEDFVNNIRKTGHVLDICLCTELLNSVETEMEELEEYIRKAVPPLESDPLVHTIKKKKDGSYFSRTQDFLDKYKDQITKDMIDSGVIMIPQYVEFNPGSAPQRVKVLNDAGWKPFNKTKTHIEREREFNRLKRRRVTWTEQYKKVKESLDKLRITGWRVDEENLGTLPEDAPEGVKKLAQWLALEGRRQDLQSWVNHYNPETGRVHSRPNSIGTNSHRMNHTDPNLGNIARPFHGEPKTPVEVIKAKYNHKMRQVWTVPDGFKQLGCDAEGIQLRILAHYMDDEEFSDVVANGKKEDKTDIHNINLQALGLDWLTRDDAKTFIYAWVLNAGVPEVQRILKSTQTEAKEAVERFLGRFPKLSYVKKELVPQFAKQQYFVGVDGRKVYSPYEHKTLSWMLQNGEAVVMKYAAKLWSDAANRAGILWRPINFVHDEWQTEVEERRVNQMAKLQVKSIEYAGRHLNIKCPLAGEARIGNNWAETH